MNIRKLFFTVFLLFSIQWINAQNDQATFTYPDGSAYVGEFKDSKYNGQGKLSYTDGSKYVGEFKNNLPNGQGTLTYPDGRKYQEEFKDGIFVE
jgi:hypothetical protein